VRLWKTFEVAGREDGLATTLNRLEAEGWTIYTLFGLGTDDVRILAYKSTGPVQDVQV